jgi:RNA polymerase sigma-70 factor (ECF subfamily)
VAVLRARLMKSARGLTRSRADAEDLVQATLARAFEHGDRLVGDNVTAWLRTILNNLASDVRKQTWRHVILPPQTLEQQPDNPPEPPSIWRHFGAEDVRTALEGCPSPFRETYALAAFEGLSNKEIARRLGIPAATVATRLFRAKAELRAKLEKTTQLPERLSRAPGRRADPPSLDVPASE